MPLPVENVEPLAEADTDPVLDKTAVMPSTSVSLILPVPDKLAEIITITVAVRLPVPANVAIATFNLQ